MSLVVRMVVVMGMIIEERKKARELYVYSSGFLCCVHIYTIPIREPLSNTFNATFAPSMHLVVTSCLLKDIKSPLVS
jgi:hypothetical protein